MNNIPISFRSAPQNFVTLLVTEAKIAAGVMLAQDMLYGYRSLESLKLKVELPMLLEMDNSGALDIQLECRWLNHACGCAQLFLAQT